MYITTTPSFEGREIKEYKGVVFGEVINGISFTKDFVAGITDFVGGRSKTYEQEIVDARTNAVNEMIERAKSLGANAIVGVSIDIEALTNTMLMVTATGTAVII